MLSRFQRLTEQCAVVEHLLAFPSKGWHALSNSTNIVSAAEAAKVVECQCSACISRQHSEYSSKTPQYLLIFQNL